MASAQSSDTSQPLAVEAAVNQDLPTSDKPYFNNVPNEVLLLIWMHLDDPVPLSRVSKRFQVLSKDTLWRAKWLMQRYERYLVIFEAIARPKIFTPALLERLLRLGAPLSRNLAQLIQLMWNAAVRSAIYDMDKSIHWGRISFPAYTALTQQAWTLYGDGINVDLSELDSTVFEEWRLNNEFYAEDGFLEEDIFPEQRDKVRQLFKDHAFMPLPVAVRSDYDYGVSVARSGTHDIYDAIIYDCELATLALSKGYILTIERTEYILKGWHENFEGVKMMAKAKLLKVDGIVNISQDYAKNLFAMLCERGRGRFPKDWQKKASLCTLLWRLNNKSALPFRLHELIEDVPAPVPPTKKQSKKQKKTGSALQKAG